MEILRAFFNIILYRPIINSLVLLYNYLPGHDFGVAIIALTCIIKIVLFPISLKSIKSQKALQEIQPQIKEIQKKFKEDKEKQAKAIMELYKKKEINPFSGCLPLLIQLPILIALFLVLKNISFDSGSIEPSLLYSFVTPPSEINPMFLGIIALTNPSKSLALLAGVFQFLQSKMVEPRSSSRKIEDFSQAMQKQMTYIFAFMTVVILWQLPAAIGLYWLTSTIFSIGQQYLIFHHQKNVNLTRNY